MMKILLVGFGGFIGTIFRYLISGWIHQFLNISNFPLGTLSVNFLGCLVIGFLGGFSEEHNIFSGETRLFLYIGLLGGFTTFSTFGYETFAFLRDGQFTEAILNVLLQVVLCLFAVWLGYIISKFL